MAAVTSAATAAAARIGAALSDAQYFESSMVRPEDIRRQLDSRSIKDKLDAMKRVIALISLGKDASMFFPDVVKNVVAASLDVKKLVYLYLVHYAEHKQDLALLAINSFQKDLSDPNQHIRALSLRVLSSIRVKVILQVVIFAINNATKDSSAYVRKAAAHAISKVCALDEASKDLLFDPLKSLLSDRSSQVLGSAVAAFDDVCPYNWSLIHPHFRRICTNLATMEPWSQVAIMQMLLRYARTHFASPYVSSKVTHLRPVIDLRNHDLSLLIDSVKPLFSSLNYSVVASAIAIFFHIASVNEFCDFAVKPLMRVVATQHDGGQAAALHIASAVAVRYPHVLIPYVSEFYVSPAQSAPIRNLRIRVLMTICAAAGHPQGIGSQPDARRTLLVELKDYLFRSDKHLAASAAKAMGCLAAAHPGSTPAIVKVLSSVVASAHNPVVVSESIAVLRRLLQRHPSAQTKALPQLIVMLLTEHSTKAASIRDPAARSSIIWLIAEFYEKVQPIATEALRLLARGFSKESSEVKVQILNLAAKVVAWNGGGDNVCDIPDGVAISSTQVGYHLLEYVVSCARYDRDYDVRDKARMLDSIFISNNGSAICKAGYALYIARKPVPDSSDAVSAEDFLDTTLDSDVIIGSMAHVLTGRRLFGFRPLESWADQDSEDILRECSSGSPSGETNTDRECVGIGNTALGKDSPSLTSSAVSWLTAQIGISASAQPSVKGGISSESVHGVTSVEVDGGLAGKGIRYAPTAFSNTRQGDSLKAVVEVDPEKFYEDDESDDAGVDVTQGDGFSEEGDDADDSDASSMPDVEDESGVDEPASRNHRLTVRDALPSVYSSPHRTGAEKCDDSLDVLGDTAETKKGVPRKERSTSTAATSEYDLDALLGNAVLSSSAATTSHGVVGKNLCDGKDDSPWNRVVEAWNANGLEVDACFVRSSPGTAEDVSPVVLRVTNRGKSEMHAVSFESKCGECFSCLLSVSLLAMGKSGDVKAECRFRGKTSGVRFAVKVGQEVVGMGEFKPSIGYVVRPRVSITPSAFAAAERLLTGMFASEATVSLRGPGQNDWMKLSTDMRSHFLKACFMAHVKTSVGGQGVNSSERFSMVFAGYLPSMTVGTHEQRPVLLRLTVKALTSGACSCVVWIGCEDVLFSANLMRMCRTVLAALDTSEGI